MPIRTAGTTAGFWKIGLFLHGLSGNILSSPIGIAVTSSVSISGLSLAGIVGVILNQVMNLTYRTKK